MTRSNNGSLPRSSLDIPMPSGAKPPRLEDSPSGLSVAERLRLVEIAHTGTADVRMWALDTLERASVEPILIRATEP